MARRAAAADLPAALRPVLVVFTPLPPMRTGIADYSYDLLGLLAGRHDIVVVTEDALTNPMVPAGVRAVRLVAYRAEPALWRRVHLYMVGNNPDHLYMLPVLAGRPGIVVLHDPGLHHLLDCATAALGDGEAYCRALAAEYGAAGAVLAGQWREHALRDRRMIHDLPMLRHILGPARHVVVHSRHAAWRALAQAPQVPVTVAPHLLQGSAQPIAGAAMRTRLGIGADEVVFLSLGFVSHIKRVDTALRALARVAGRLPPFRYVVAGEVRPEEVDVAGLAARLGLTDHLVLTGFVAPGDLDGMIAMADVVINLRHPVGGETSGTLVRALGAGACVVVVDDGPFAEIPDGAAVKLRWGPGIEADLADALLRLAAAPVLRTEIGARAAADTARRHGPGRVVAAYEAAIRCAAAADRPWRRTAALVHATGQEAAPEDAPLWRRLDAMPRLEPPGMVVARGDAADLAALCALGFAAENAGETWTPDAMAERCCDAMLLIMRRGDRLLRVPDLPARLNRVLRFGGVVVVEIRDLAPDAHVLASRARGPTVWRRAGFVVTLDGVAQSPGGRAPEPPRVVWRALKVAESGLARGEN
jgi:glycosyltransferase involved in cell wall biosynthesis